MNSKGKSIGDVRHELAVMRSADRDRRTDQWATHGFFFTWHVNDEVMRIGAEAYAEFLATDNISGGMYPSVRRMRDELIVDSRKLFHADERAAGILTTGGTESVIIGLKCARDRFLQKHPGRTGLRLLCPTTAHPACEKAGDILGFDVVRVPVDSQYSAGSEQFLNALTDDTFAIVAAACNPWHGTTDRIGEIAELAVEHDLWLHVDACVGGFIAPYIERTGYDIEPFDFRIDGVRSISADFHKYGYSPKGASIVVFGSGVDAARGTFVYQDEYLRYETAGIVGTRGGGPIAAAWAVRRYLGDDGYAQTARSVRESLDRVRKAVDSIEGPKVHGNPQLGIVSFGSDNLDMTLVGNHLVDRGWHPNVFGRPAYLMLRIVPCHADVIDEFVEALVASVAATRQGLHAKSRSEGYYAASGYSQHR